MEGVSVDSGVFFFRTAITPGNNASDNRAAVNYTC